MVELASEGEEALLWALYRGQKQSGFAYAHRCSRSAVLISTAALFYTDAVYGHDTWLNLIQCTPYALCSLCSAHDDRLVRQRGS